MKRLQRPLQRRHHLHCLPSLCSLTNNAALINPQHIATGHFSKRHCASNHNDNDHKPPPAQSMEERLKATFLSKYSRKIQSSSTPAAWGRYKTEIKKDDGPRMAQDAFHEGFRDPEYETPEEADYDPHRKWGIPRGTFRGIVIGISCAIGAALFFTLRPDPISEEKERQNMHYFARLNADPAVHVTYSGLMYRVIEQHDLNDEDTDINLLTNPNPDVHCCDIDYEGRFIDGTVFDSSFDARSQGGGCVFPAKSLIAGLHQGLTNMTRESVFEFYMPPHLGYGERGSEFIPPHEPLVFKVRLNDFWKDQDLNRPRRFKLID